MLSVETTLMTGFACLAVCTLAFFVMARADATKRFNYVALLVTAIAATAYCSMAFGLGIVEVAGRNVYWLRYLDWFFTTPLLLLDLAMLAGADFWDTFFVLGMDGVMIFAGALGALNPAGKWPLFIIGMVAFLLFLVKLFSSMSAQAHKLGGSVYNKFTTVSTISMGIWWVYPLLFVLCEGTGFLGEELEVLAYAIIDVLTKGGMGFLLLSNHGILEATTKAPLLG